MSKTKTKSKPVYSGVQGFLHEAVHYIPKEKTDFLPRSKSPFIKAHRDYVAMYSKDRGLGKSPNSILLYSQGELCGIVDNRRKKWLPIFHIGRIEKAVTHLEDSPPPRWYDIKELLDNFNRPKQLRRWQDIVTKSLYHTHGANPLLFVGHVLNMVRFHNLFATHNADRSMGRKLAYKPIRMPNPKTVQALVKRMNYYRGDAMLTDFEADLKQNQKMPWFDKYAYADHSFYSLKKALKLKYGALPDEFNHPKISPKEWALYEQMKQYVKVYEKGVRRRDVKKRAKSHIENIRTAALDISLCLKKLGETVPDTVTVNFVREWMAAQDAKMDTQPDTPLCYEVYRIIDNIRTSASKLTTLASEFAPSRMQEAANVRDAAIALKKRSDDAEQRHRIAKWRAGTITHIRIDSRDILRLHTNPHGETTVQTSGGVVLTMGQALSYWQQVDTPEKLKRWADMSSPRKLSVRDSRTNKIEYNVEDVRQSLIHVGCHTFEYGEFVDFAPTLLAKVKEVQP